MPNRISAHAAAPLGHDAESIARLGEELKRALPQIRMQSVSVHGSRGETLWTAGEAALGSQEQAAVLEALGVFRVEPQRKLLTVDLDDGRGAALLVIRSEGDQLVGAAMILGDWRTIRGFGPILAGGGSKPWPIIARIAAELNDQPPVEQAKSEPSESQEALEDDSAPLNIESLLQGDDAAAADANVGASAESGSEYMLFAQRLVPFRPSSRTLRFEVLLRSKLEPDRNEIPEAAALALTEPASALAIDRFVVKELALWLEENRPARSSDSTRFSINLTRASLADPEFMSFVETTLAEHKIDPEMIGFEITESDAVAEPAHAVSFAARCEALGCFMVLDDFTFHSGTHALLNSRALGAVKIQGQLCAAAVHDRVAQALVVSIAHASRVLGIQCVAKRVDSTAVRSWLEAAGVDMVQGNLLESAQPLGAGLSKR